MPHAEGLGHFHRCPNVPITPAPAYSPAWNGEIRTLLTTRPTRPVLAWGHDLVSAEAVAALHAHGCHVLETWPGDTLVNRHQSEHLVSGGAAGNAKAIHSMIEATQCRQWDGRPLVLLISDVDSICSTGRAALGECFDGAKQKLKELKKPKKKPAAGKRKRGGGAAPRPRPGCIPTSMEWTPPADEVAAPPPIRVVCTCSDYYASSMKTVMHRLVSKKDALQLSAPGRSSSSSVRTPWACVDIVRRRPSEVESGPDGLTLTARGDSQARRQAEADQLLREDPRILATLVEHCYSLRCVAEGPRGAGPPSAARPFGYVQDPVGVSEHLSVCDLLSGLSERKRKLHVDDNDPALILRPGADPYIASLAMGLALRPREIPQYLTGAFPTTVRTTGSRDAALHSYGGPLVVDGLSAAEKAARARLHEHFHSPTGGEVS